MFPFSPCLTLKPFISKVLASPKVKFSSQESASVLRHTLHLFKVVKESWSRKGFYILFWIL